MVLNTHSKIEERVLREDIVTELFTFSLPTQQFIHQPLNTTLPPRQFNKPHSNPPHHQDSSINPTPIPQHHQTNSLQNSYHCSRRPIQSVPLQYYFTIQTGSTSCTQTPPHNQTNLLHTVKPLYHQTGSISPTPPQRTVTPIQSVPRQPYNNIIPHLRLCYFKSTKTKSILRDMQTLL